MKNYLLAYGCAMLLLASCTSPSGETKAPGQIDIVGKIKNPTELKASDFLKETKCFFKMRKYSANLLKFK